MKNARLHERQVSLLNNLLDKKSMEDLQEHEINFMCDPPLCSYVALKYKRATDDNMLVLVRTIFLINSICQQTMLKSLTLIETWEGLLNNWTLIAADIQERAKLSGKFIATSSQLEAIQLMYAALKELLMNVNKGIATKAWQTACAETRVIFGRSN